MLSQAAASKASSKLAPIQEVVKSVAGSAAGELLALPCAPPLTWNVLRAMLLVMGKPPQDIDTWLKCRYASCIGGFVKTVHMCQGSHSRGRWLGPLLLASYKGSSMKVLVAFCW